MALTKEKSFCSVFLSLQGGLTKVSSLVDEHGKFELSGIIGGATGSIPVPVGVGFASFSRGFLEFLRPYFYGEVWNWQYI